METRPTHEQITEILLMLESKPKPHSQELSKVIGDVKESLGMSESEFQERVEKDDRNQFEKWKKKIGIQTAIQAENKLLILKNLLRTKFPNVPETANERMKMRSKGLDD